MRKVTARNIIVLQMRGERCVSERSTEDGVASHRLYSPSMECDCLPRRSSKMKLLHPLEMEFMTERIASKNGREARQ